MLLASVMVKQYYLSMITDVLEESYETELESFEEDFKKMLEVSDHSPIRTSGSSRIVKDKYALRWKNTRLTK